MIIDFSNIGGGGGGYVLPVATSNTLGGVKIGEGININSAGTISVTGSTGGGIEVVTELPASGTDGQMVLLETNIPEKHLHITGIGTDWNPTQSITAIGITTKTKLFDYNNWNVLNPVYINADGSYSIYDTSLQQENIYPIGETTAYTITSNVQNMTVTGTVTTTGCTFTVDPANTWRQNATADFDQNAEERQVLYTWSDNQELTADIIYTTISTPDTWCVKYKYSELPNNKTILVTKYKYGDDYSHFVYNNGTLTAYKSDNASAYTTTSATTVAQYGVEVNNVYVYWTDDEMIFISRDNYRDRVSFNVDDFYKAGWHKNIEHKLDNKAFYKDNTYYDGDYQIILRHPRFPMYDVALKINPSNKYAEPYNVYSKNNSTIGPFFAPTTTGNTGYVCVAGNGWAAPTWTAPESLTNGVKFWKGTQDEYDAIGEGNYDSSTLYIIVEE